MRFVSVNGELIQVMDHLPEWMQEDPIIAPFWFKDLIVDSYQSSPSIAEYVANKALELTSNGISYILDSIHSSLPEIGAFITLIFGVLIMVTGNFPKWFTRYGIVMTGVIVWLIMK